MCGDSELRLGVWAHGLELFVWFSEAHMLEVLTRRYAEARSIAFSLGILRAPRFQEIIMGDIGSARKPMHIALVY